METPTNGGYAKDEVPENPGEKVKILGMVFQKGDAWKILVVIGGVFVLVLFFILFLMPSGISFLAAKNASGLLGYMALFTGYMLGFIFIVSIFFAVILWILYLIQRYA